MKTNQQKIAIIGMSGYFPEAADIQQFYQNLCAGRDSVRPVAANRLADCRLRPDEDYQVVGSLDRVDAFDYKFFGMAKRDADYLDPAHRIGLELACQAIEQAGYRLSAFDGSNTGVFLGAKAQPTYYKLIDQLTDPAVMTGNLSAMAAGRIAFALNLTGPALMIDTACSSSLVAVHEACQQLRYGEIDYALAGGMNVLTDFPERNPDTLGIASPDGKARAFDANASGTGVGEGGGMVLLKRYEDAIADGDQILAILLGSAINQDGGRSNGLTAPSPVAQTEVLTKAWQKAGVSPETITYIEAHGTGTKLGDPIEIQGLSDAFRTATTGRQFCAVSGVKTNFGHLDNAAGIAGLIKAVLALRYRKLFPSVHFQQPNPFIDFQNSAVYINATLTDWPATDTLPRRCGVSAFGLSGTNAHVVLEESLVKQTPKPVNRPVRLKISAKTPTAFRAYVQRIHEALKTGNNAWRDVVATLTTGRDDYAYRALLTATDKETLIQQLATLADTTPRGASAAGAVLLLPNEVIPVEEFYNLLASEPGLNRIYTQLITETAELAVSESARELLRQLALFRFWEGLGIPTKAIIANGTGKRVKDVVMGQLRLSEALTQQTEAGSGEAPDREKVAKAVSALLATDKSLAFVELGAGSTLATALQEVAELPKPVISLIDSDTFSALSISELYEIGLPIDWKFLYPSGTYQRVEAPTYPFDRVRCWAFEPTVTDVVKPVVTVQPLPKPTPEAVVPEPTTEIAAESENLSIEARIEAIWKEVLKADEIDYSDDFFAVGGHSLNGAQVANRMAKAFGIEVTLDTIFDYGTIQELADYIRPMIPAEQSTENALSVENLEPIPSPDVLPAHYPASYTQERIWFVSQFKDAQMAYNMVTAASLRGSFNPSLFQQALTDVYERYEVLRTVFRLVDGEPRQFVNAPANPSPDWRYIDLVKQPEWSIDAVVAEEYTTPFDLQTGPLIRATVVQQQPNQHVFLITVHHLIADGWSLTILLDELIGAYQRRITNQPVVLPDLPTQYRHFAHWQRDQLGSASYEQARAFWLDEFKGELPLLDLPTDKPRPVVKSYRGDNYRIALSVELTRQMTAFAESNGYTLFILLRTALTVLLHRYTGQRDIIIGSPFSGRTQREWEHQIGLFMSVVGLRTQLDENQSVHSLLRQIREHTFRVFVHQHYPFDQLSSELGLVRDVSRSPLFDVLLAVQNYRDAQQPLMLNGVSFEPYPLDEKTSKYDLSFYVETGSQQVDLTVEYCTDLFERATIERMTTHLEAVLASLVSQPDQSINAVTYLSDVERQQVVTEFNQTDRVYDLDQPVHERFEAQVGQTPEAVALRFRQRSYSYQELNQQANKLAHYLINEQGVQPDDLVAVLADRSDYMLIALLGILKTGAAYLPIAADLPIERIRYMLDDSQVSVLLTDQSLDAIDSAVRPSATIQQILQTDQPTTNPAVALTTQSRMYVMYTSGSTGKPKGVELRHRSVLNFLHSMQEHFSLKPEQTFLSVTTFIFDISVLEFFLPLINGASVTMADKEAIQNPIRLAALIEQVQPDLMQATPSLWQMLVDTNWRGLKTMRILCGGEKLSRELGRHLLERGRELYNLYGPTETTIWSTIQPVQTPDQLGTIGKPIANTQLHVVSADGHLCGIGVFGEICIAGEGLAKGYLNRPDLTASRFVPNLATNDGILMYRTGDRGRWLPTGEIEFLGRTDNQVKIHGHRIELGEIEDVLLRYEGVSQAVVTVHEPRENDKELVAYLVAEGELSVDAIRQFIGRHLAPYMIPANFRRMTAMPMTANRKIDRNKLSPDLGEPLSASTQPAQAAATDVEKQIDALVRQVIRAENVGITSNLFEHGLNSIRVIALHQLLTEAYPGGIDIHEIFSNPTVRQLTQLLTSRIEPTAQSAILQTEEIDF